MTVFPLNRLGSVCERVSVGHVGKTSPYYQDSGIPFLRTQNVGEGYLLLKEMKYVSTDFHEKLSKSQIRGGDVLISRVISDRVNCAVIPEDFGEANCANVILVRPGSKLDPKYFVHFISSPIAQRQLLRCRVGSAQSVVNTKVVESWLIPLPRIEEQRRIAAILDKADAVRRKRQQAIALTEELLRAAFLEMFGDSVTNPKGWEVCQLKDFSTIQSGIAKGKKIDRSKAVSIPYMRVANVQDGYLDLSEIKTLEILPTDIDKYILREGDLLLTEGGDPDKLGRGAIWYGKIQPCVHQNHIFCVRPDQTLAEPEYLSALIGSERGKRYFLQAAKQTTGIATINKTQLYGFPAFLPPLYLQQKYTQIVKVIRSTRTKLDDKYEQTDKFFNSLLQRAFSGKL